MFDIDRLEPFRALADLEGDGCTFIEGFEALLLDVRVVDEDIFVVLLGIDEPVAFVVVEPLFLYSLFAQSITPVCQSDGSICFLTICPPASQIFSVTAFGVGDSSGSQRVGVPGSQ